MGTTGLSITLANSIIGVGILAMPFCFQQCGVLLASLILLSMGLVSRLCCYYLLKSALLARRRTFEFLAFSVFGPAGKCAVEIGIIGFLMGSCIAYFVVVGDLGPQIIAKIFNINQSDILRTSIMVIVSLVCILPLGLLRNVDSLSNVSAATICFYFCLVLKVILEAASQLFSGSSDWTTRVELWRPAGLLQCVPILSMALFCQTQLFEIFESMPTLSLEKMTVVSKNAINICTAVYFTLGLFGYIAFHDHEISGNILMSLSPTMGSDVIKLGFVMSVAFSFPLIIFPCRASLYSFLYKKVHSSHHDHIINHSIPETSFRCITVAIIAVSLFISLLIPNIELVLGLVGSTIGVLICVVFPAACFVNVTFKNTNERILAKAIVILGLVIMVLGTYANLEAAENKHDRYDETKITQERIDKIVEDFFQKRENVEGRQSFQAIDLIPKEEVKNNGIGDKQKESEIQPPNPVPPEPSNEKTNIDKPVEEKKKPKPEDKSKLKDTENEYDKVSETHPKNLKKNNGVNNYKDTDIKSEIEKLVKKVPEEKASKAKTREQDKGGEKKDIIKQQQLIETIKQHGEEQKELLKEQKELLDEIIKTKNEMEQNKKEVDSIEAKKLAVESIQKIADIAIKSLSGVTDKPIAAKEEPLDKLANKAVQEIAKKAVETIEAIKEIKETPLENLPKQDNNALDQLNVANSDLLQNAAQSIQNVQGYVQNNPPRNSLNLQPILNALPAVYKQQHSVNNQLSANEQQPLNKNMQQDSNIEQQKLNNQELQQAQQLSNQQLHADNSQNQKAANIQQHQNVQQSQQSTNMQQQNEVNTQQKNFEHQQQFNNIKQQHNADTQPVVNNQEHVNLQYNANVQQQSNMQQGNQQQLIENAHRSAQHNANIQQDSQQNGNLQPVAQNLQQAANSQAIYQNNDAQLRHNRDVHNDAPVINKDDTVQNEVVQNDKQKAHAHSPDEPQSYKEGEDFEMEKIKNIAQNAPIPIAMNGDVNLNTQVEKEIPSNIKESEIKSHGKNTNFIQQDSNNVKPYSNHLENNGAKALDGNVEQENINNVGQIRHKREVVDCTKINTLKLVDKEICKNLVNNPKIIDDTHKIFTNDIDLHNVELPKNIQMHETMIHHIRSLKSLPESKKR